MASPQDVPTRRDRPDEEDTNPGLPPPPATSADQAVPPPPAAPTADQTLPAPPPSAGAAARHLYRSRTDQVLGGVCGGLGRYLGVDPVILRIAFIALTLGGGAGVLLYIIAWIAIPEEPAGGPPPGADAEAGSRWSPRTATMVVGGTLVGLGLLLLLDRTLPDLGDVAS